MRLLVGDIGGTNSRFGIAERAQCGRLSISDVARLHNQKFSAFQDCLAHWLENRDPPHAALFAVAGPVEDNAATLTNRGWRIDADAIAERFKIARVIVRNDFEAMARAVPELEPESFHALRAGQSVPDAPIVVAGPGTGFGLAALVPSRPGWWVIGGEGGHQAFAPQTDFEWRIAQILARTDYVSVERVAAGAHYEEVFAAVCEARGNAPRPTPPPEELLLAAHNGDSLAIAVCAVRAAATVDACADAVLTFGARGGCVIAGGVAEGLLPFLQEPAMLARFDAHGPMAGYLSRVEIRILTDPGAPLMGAAALFEDLMR